MDEETGNSSRLIDLSNGGFTIIMGNLFMQGNNAPNHNLIGYGKEGLSNTSAHELYFINNTLVNKRVSSCLFIDIKEGTVVANVSNNIFAGTGTIINGTTTSMSNNLIETNIASLDFVDEQNYNYDLNATSPAIDYGTEIPSVGGYSLTPDSTYLHLSSSMPRAIVNNMIDAGAYEYGELVATNDLNPTVFAIYPNPTTGIVNIGYDINQIENVSTYNHLGQSVHLNSYARAIINLSTVPKGVYFLKIKLKNGALINKTIVKK